MRRWFRQLRDDFMREYRRATVEPQSVQQSVVQPQQASVEIIVWRARGCGQQPGTMSGHETFDENCSLCWHFTHCPDHPEFDGDCLRCRAMKDPDIRGTVSHYHADPAKQAAEAELGQGTVIWHE